MNSTPLASEQVKSDNYGHLDFSPREYLARSRERVGHLRSIIDGRPVAILAAGPSIRQLEERIGELRDANVCFFGLNDFTVQETHILVRIARRFSVVMCSAREHMPEYIGSIVDFLSREEDNMFVSSYWRNTFELMGNGFDLRTFLGKYDHKLLFFGVVPRRDVPNSFHPLHFTVSNSLLVLVQLAAIGGAPGIVLFGADGYSGDTERHAYYRGQGDSDDARRESLKLDVDRYFNPIASIAMKNVSQTYEVRPGIVNCSESSYLTPFPKVSYDTAFQCLLTGRGFDRIADLRVPKVSIICPSSGTERFLDETFGSIAEQSYSSREHLVLRDRAIHDAETLGGHLGGIRCLPFGNPESTGSIRDGLSVARGEYVAWCRIGDVLADRDWINECVEIMENSPEISLVWGLSAHSSTESGTMAASNVHWLEDPPPQGKWFIYRWLREKTVFPRGAVCVRRAVLDACLPPEGASRSEEADWLAFNYRFNMLGYLPHFIPKVACYCPASTSAVDNPVLGRDCAPDGPLREYQEDIERYLGLLLAGRATHRYRHASGELLQIGFNRGIFVFFDLVWYVLNAVPRRWLAWPHGARRAWRIHRWGVARIGFTRTWNRMKLGVAGTDTFVSHSGRGQRRHP